MSSRSPASTAKPAEAAGRAATKPTTILAVDDSSVTLELLVCILTMAGYQVRTAANGEQALADVAAHPPDLILLDIRMEGIDGLEVCRRLKASEKTRPIPIILFSGTVETQEKIQGLMLGASDYISKPFQTEELLARVQTQLALSQATISLEHQAAALRQTNEQLQVEMARRQQVEDEQRLLLDRAERSRRAMLGTLEDQKLIEAKLQAEQQNLKAIFAAAPVGMILIDENGIIVNSNAVIARLMSRDPGQIIQQHFCRGLGCLHSFEGSRSCEYSPACEECGLKKAARLSLDSGDSVRGIELQHPLLIDGREVHPWLSINTEPVSVNGRRQVIVTIEDITERKQSEATLRLNSAALEAAANAIVITDHTGAIEWCNTAFTTFTGYSKAEVIGKNLRFLSSGQHDAAFFKNLWDTILAGKVWHGELINRRKDGSLHIVDMTITPLKDARGETTHFIAVKQDITARKKLEEQFRQSQKMEAFGQLAGGVAHDFNNILTVIQGNAMLMQTGRSEVEKQHSLQEISDAAARAAALTRQLLAFSRKQVIQSQQLDLNKTATGMGRILQRLIGENIALKIQLMPKAAIVQADPGMIEQILLNLAVNARDAMPEGGQLTIKLENVTLDKSATARLAKARPGDFIRLSVCDTGHGIMPEVLPHIFEPFFTTKDVGKGTGLGLATAHGIVEQHHGWIEVESQAGWGTTFHVYLPCLGQTAKLPDEKEVIRTAPGGGETILLVEDELSLRKLAARVLELNGYKVIPVDSGAAAQQAWRDHGHEVDLLLTDIIMPEGVSGRQLVEQLQMEQPGLKIIYMSGYPGEVSGRGLELREGVNFLQKPFTPAKLGQIVRNCLDNVAK